MPSSPVPYLLLSVLFIMLLDLAFTPWIYTVGGRVRLVPVWVGTGVVRAPWGSFTIFLSFSPSPGGLHSPGAGVEGGGWVCTPQGQKYSLRVTGGASGHIWNDMDGHTMSISAYYRPFAWQYHREDRRPALSFSGQWVGPNLVMNDNGSVARAFHPDGTLKSYRESLPFGRDTLILPVVFTEGNYQLAFAGCPPAKGF
jgi:hypothetical protein